VEDRIEISGFNSGEQIHHWLGAKGLLLLVGKGMRCHYLHKFAGKESRRVQGLAKKSRSILLDT